MSKFEMPPTTEEENAADLEIAQNVDSVEIAQDVKDVESSENNNKDFSPSRRKFLGGVSSAVAVAFTAANIPGVLTEAKAGNKELQELIERDNLKMEKVPSLEAVKHEMWELAMNEKVEHMVYVVRKGEQYYKVFPKVESTEDKVAIMKSTIDTFSGANISDFDEVRNIHTHPRFTTDKIGEEFDDENHYQSPISIEINNSVNGDYIRPAQPSFKDITFLISSAESMMYHNNFDKNEKYPLYMDVESPRYSWSTTPDYDNEVFRKVCAERKNILAPFRQQVEKMSDVEVKNSYMEFTTRSLQGVDIYDIRAALVAELLQKAKTDESIEVEDRINERLDSMSKETLIKYVTSFGDTKDELEERVILYGKDQEYELAREIYRRGMKGDFRDPEGQFRVSGKYQFKEFDKVLDTLKQLETDLWQNSNKEIENRLINQYVDEMRKMGFIVTCKERPFKEYMNKKKIQEALDKISGHNSIEY